MSLCYGAFDVAVRLYTLNRNVLLSTAFNAPVAGTSEFVFQLHLNSNGLFGLANVLPLGAAVSATVFQSYLNSCGLLDLIATPPLVTGVYTLSSD